MAQLQKILFRTVLNLSPSLPAAILPRLQRHPSDRKLLTGYRAVVQILEHAVPLGSAPTRHICSRTPRLSVTSAFDVGDQPGVEIID